MVQNVLSGRLPDGYALPARDAATGDATRVPATSAVVTNAEHDVSGTLSVVTKDGDTFTLSASLDTSVTYAGVRGGAGTASAQASNSVSVQMQGNFSRKELRDLRHVVARFLHDLRQMARGGQPSIANVTAVHATTLRSITASTDTQDSLTAIAVPGRPQLAPAPAVPVGSDSPAQPAPTFDEKPDPEPAPSPALSARG